MIPGDGNQVFKLIDRTEFGMNGIVTTLCRANAVGNTRLIRQAGNGVVFAFAVGRSDGVNRWQIQHIEAHTGNARQ